MNASESVDLDRAAAEAAGGHSETVVPTFSFGVVPNNRKPKNSAWKSDSRPANVAIYWRNGGPDLSGTVGTDEIGAALSLGMRAAPIYSRLIIRANYNCSLFCDLGAAGAFGFLLLLSK